MVEVRNISFAYEDNLILRDVSFVVSPGEIVSVVGSNGAGKTTLLKVMAMLAVPSSGSIMIDGQNVLVNSLRYRHQIGYLSEKSSLYDDMTVKDYLVYRANLKGELSKRIKRRVSDAAELCKITGLMRCSIRNLSAGNMKRVALADALLLRPRVLLLDDFLSGMDRELRHAMGEILSSAASFSSVIVTGHEVVDFAKWTTRFLVLRNGVIADSIDALGIESSSVIERVDSAIEGVL